MMRRWNYLGRVSLASRTLLVFVLAQAAQSMPVLSEVYYDATGSDDGQVFVEIAGTPGASLGGLVLEGVNGSNGAIGPSIVLSGMIGEGGLFVVADRRSDGTSLVVGADFLANFDFQNGPDSVVLRNDTGVLDAIGYGVFSPSEFFAGEGAPTPDVSPGSSLARRFANVDTGDNAADFLVLNSPTPGTAPFAIIPEPSSALLMALGLTGLAGIRRDPRRAAVHGANSL